ncbi:hypothetical protein DL96DRAFT_1750120 [Flagelloscypha sp. PMI_526]|nr:hypothetical protein DL96DRAFT_1750120 [Flagelloscypha sp. PMI_526]
MTSDVKNIVIVGGSSGAKAAREISHRLDKLSQSWFSKKTDSTTYNIVLVSKNSFSTWMPASIRHIVSQNGELGETFMLPYDRIFPKKNGTILQGTVVNVFPAKSGGSGGGTIELANGDVLDYDVLVLATGSTWEGPLAFHNQPTEDTTKEYIVQTRKQIKDAKSIVLVGGGSVGCEFSGEIRDEYPDKPITIVHMGSLLLNDAYPERFRRRVDKSVRERNIDIVYNDAIDEISSFPALDGVRTRNGKHIPADLVLSARGGRPNTSFLNATPLSSSLNGKGQVQIRSTFQLKQGDSIFAMGDITDLPEQKTIKKANEHASYIAQNVLAFLDGKSKMKEYKPSGEAIAVVNGRRGGVTYLGILWGIVLGNWFTRLIKSGNLLIPMFNTEMGY